jgi:hypothetical protein
MAAWHGQAKGKSPFHLQLWKFPAELCLKKECLKKARPSRSWGAHRACCVSPSCSLGALGLKSVEDFKISKNYRRKESKLGLLSAAQLRSSSSCITDIHVTCLCSHNRQVNLAGIAFGNIRVNKDARSGECVGVNKLNATRRCVLQQKSR